MDSVGNLASDPAFFETAEYRPGFGRGLAVAIAVLGGAAIIWGLITNAAAIAPFIAPILLVVVLTWAAYWRPAVVVTPAGVELRNVTRTIDLPWPTIQRIDTKFALTLYTAYGVYSAWAAPAPGRSGAAGIYQEQNPGLVGRGLGGPVRASRDATRNLPESTYSGGTIGLGDLATSPSGSAAMLVRRRWEAMRDAGLLDDPRVERDRPRVRWHAATLAAIAVLAAASLLPLVL